MPEGSEHHASSLQYPDEPPPASAIPEHLPSADELLTKPTMTILELGAIMRVSETTIREQHRSGELEALGIRIPRLGRSYRVITSSVRTVLGLHEPADQPDEKPRDGGP